MSERLKRANWVQNIIHNPKILSTVNEKTFDGIARLVELMSTKYEWDRGLIVEITPS